MNYAIQVDHPTSKPDTCKSQRPNKGSSVPNSLGEMRKTDVVSPLTRNVFEPVREKTNNLGGFRPGPTQTGRYTLRRWLEAWNFVFE